MKTVTRALLALLIGMLGAVTLSVTPANAVDSTPSCENGVFNGAGAGPLDKSLVSIVDNQDGSYDFTYKLTSPRPAGTYRIRDCVFIDDTTPGYNGETLIGNTDEKDVVFLADGQGSSATTTVTLTGITADDSICDRAAVSGTDVSTSQSFTDKSNLLCVTINTPPVVPEVGLVVLLPLTGLALAGGFLLWRRRSTGQVETA